MSRSSHQGYSWAVAAGINAALAAVSAKLFSSLAFSFLLFLSSHNFYLTSASDLDMMGELLKYGLVLFFNATMWGCYINSLKVLSSLQATVTNFATNFISSGLAGFFLFQEPLPSRWFAGAFFIIIGVFILSKSNIEKKSSQD
ncbi:uncharacterized protein LOC110027923 isoform X2 [Phalaenopsis equestris]|uniref:uncharacterized protein LOC110027923 isoform X2 n=1 Tax=Phalaenopsis equestris TaxID=78828 RepID=UPI0009E47962|nr:uncharacterized protein LOC110027923 isoform X2 [Phalaenopsis equestris]